MALIVADRVKETTDTTGGTSAYNLLGAETGFQTFSSTVGDGNTTYYACTDGTDFEIGIGTYASSTDTLARTTILQSSNSDSAVVWSAGTKDIFVTLPAEKAIFEDASNNVAIGNNITVGGTVDGVDIATRDGVLTTTTTTANAAMPKAGGTFTGDVVFEGSTVNITFDESGNSLNFDDGARAYFGSSSDLTIYHEGIINNETRLWNVTGDVSFTNFANDKDIIIATDDGSGGTANYFVADGSTGEAQLFHYGSEKLATQSGGVDVTGNITVSGTVDGVDIATRDGVLTTTTTTANAAMPKAGGTFTGDVTFTGDTYNVVWDKSDDALEFPDNAKIVLGTGGDYAIYNNGASTEELVFEETTGGASGTFTFKGDLSGLIGPVLRLEHDVSGANGNFPGTLQVRTKDAGGTDFTAFAIYPRLIDSTSGASTSEATFYVKEDGDTAALEYMKLDGDAEDIKILKPLSVTGGDITFETDDANKTILFDKSANALHFKRPSGPDAYGKSPEILFNFAGSSKIFDEFTQNINNFGLNIKGNSNIHLDTPYIVFRNGDASGEETLEISPVRLGNSFSLVTLYQPELNPTTHPTNAAYSHNLYTAALGSVTYTVDYGNNTTFDDFGLSFILDKEQDTVANNDAIALFIFQGNDSAGNNHGYAKITGIMQDVTDTAEDGILRFSVSRGGSYVDYFEIDGDADHTLFLKPIAFEGSTADAFETTLDVVDPTQDNTLNLPNESGTIATRAHAVALASVLG